MQNKNIIQYIRVSTDEQADKGYSLDQQRRALDNYCIQHNLNALKLFQEDFSARNFERPAFKELLSYVKANKKVIDGLLFTRWDRFSRNIEDSYRMIREFRDMGIEVNSIEQRLDFEQGDSKILLSLFLSIGEAEFDKISLRTRLGLREAMKQGAYVGKAPFGYFHDRNAEGKSTLKPNPEIAPIIKKVFEEYATGIYSTEEIRKKYMKAGLSVSKNGLLSILKNPAYCGKVAIGEWKKEDAMIVEGLHPAIVDTDIFQRVQCVFSGKQIKSIHEPKLIDEILPIRGFLKCPDCGRSLTGSGSMGGANKRHYYYHCLPKGSMPACKVRYKLENVHMVMESLLKELVIKEDFKKVYEKILEKTFKNRFQNRDVEINSIKREVNKLEERFSSINMKYFDNEINYETYSNFKVQTEVRLANARGELELMLSVERDFEAHLKTGISFLQKIDVLYKKAPVSIKKKILGAIFSEKLIFEGTHFKTRQIDEFIGYIIEDKRLKYLKVDKPIAEFNFRNMRIPAAIDIE